MRQGREFELRSGVAGPEKAQADDLFRREAGKISAWLARLLGPARLDLIEDAVQDAFGAALARWPHDGMPERPAAWLAVAARNKALDRLRKDAKLGRIDENAAWRLGFCDPKEAGRLDDTLALMFVACHPALERDEQVMLTLKTVCGFGVKEIARAYLSNAEAVTQRLVRAKRKIRELGLAFEIPDGEDLALRLPALIEAIYLLFNGGYTSGEGQALMRRELCAEALRLASLLTEHRATATGECHALAALISFQHARAEARTGDAGALILLAEQDRSLWNHALIARGFAHQQKAMQSDRLTALHLEAAIASVHAAARSFAETDWPMLAHHYHLLHELKPTPIVELNAAIALAHAEGPGAGLARLDKLAGARKLAHYAPYHAARGDLLSKLERRLEAGEAFAKALGCEVNDAEREHLEQRMRECAEVAPLA
ncbi:MAG: RNA polymerase sigma factor [Hyphomicrobiales bacterium]